VHAEDQDYLVMAATRARGAHVNLYDRKKAGPDFFQAWGQVTGQMHHLAKAYPWWCKHPVEIEVPSPIHDWRQEFESFRRWSSDDTEIQAKWIELGESIASLPINRESYGLIHNDLHPHNFLVDREGQITVIDFDVCTFHFFIKDIAIALFFADWMGKPARNQSRDAYLTSFTQNFLRGYANQNDLDDLWYSELPRVDSTQSLGNQNPGEMAPPNPAGYPSGENPVLAAGLTHPKYDTLKGSSLDLTPIQDIDD
jgi:Ser/Thr protein kinase RdoA (MazF antagonist)